MKQNRAIDLTKFICAILIIILHTNPFGSYSKLLSFGFRNIITVIAVPFFFISSGYIFCSKINNMSNKEEKTAYYKKYVMRLITMYLCWSAIYFIFVLIRWLRKGFSGMLVIEYIRDFFFEGSYSTIWFLPALITAVTIVYLLRKKFSYQTIFLMAIPFYIFTLGGSSYLHLVSKVPFLNAVYNLYYIAFDTIKNGFLFGFIYIAIGGILSEKKPALKLTKKMNIFLIIVGFIFLAVEELAIVYFKWSHGCDTVIMLIPLSFLIFNLLLNIDLKENNVYIKLRKYSLLMFLCQRIPLSIIEMFMAKSIFYTNTMLYFVTVLISTFIISWLIIKLSSKYKCLKYLY